MKFIAFFMAWKLVFSQTLFAYYLFYKIALKITLSEKLNLAVNVSIETLVFIELELIKQNRSSPICIICFKENFIKFRKELI